MLGLFLPIRKSLPLPDGPAKLARGELMLILEIPFTPFWYHLHAIATNWWIVVVDDFATIAETVRAPALGNRWRDDGSNDGASIRWPLAPQAGTYSVGGFLLTSGVIPPSCSLHGMVTTQFASPFQLSEVRTRG